MNIRRAISLKQKKKAFIQVIVLLILMTGVKLPIAHATPILLLDSDYQLLGAKNVLIDGWSYNVSFVEGSCNSIYSGCDRYKFLFKTESYATKASQALLDQVFLDIAPHLLFDSLPWTTYGIDSPFDGFILTPYDTYFPAGDNERVRTIAADNSNSPCCDSTLRIEPYTTTDTSSLDPNGNYVYALWSVSVPEPASIALLAIGLTGLIFGFRREKPRKNRVREELFLI